MKRSLLTPTSNILSFFTNTKRFCLLLFLMIGFSGVAQITPYSRFESFNTSIPSGFTSIVAGWTYQTSTTLARSGQYYSRSTGAGSTIETPSIPNLKTFSFYVAKSAAAGIQMAYQVQYNINGAGWYDIKAPNAGDILTSVTANALPTVAPPTNSPYQLVTVTFDSSHTNIKLRIKDARVAGSGNLLIDDIAWTSYNFIGALVDNTNLGYPNNPVIAPVQNGSGAAPTPNAGSVTPVIVASNAIYKFYDNGGESDNYNNSQANVVTFKPATTGEKVRITFNSYASATDDFIEVFDDLTTTNRVLNHTSGANITTSITSITTDGAITIKFTSNTTLANLAGFYITVDISPCSLVGAVTIANITSTGADINWVAASPTPANYDVYYSTSNTPPAPGAAATPSFTVSGSTLTQSLAGLLSANTPYYVWVRTKCSATNYGTWVAATPTIGSFPFTTPCGTVNVPYIQDFSSVVAPAIPVCNTTINTVGSWVTSATNGAAYGFDATVARFSDGAGTQDAWYITQGINLVTTKTYRLTFTYSNSTTTTESLRVAMGTNNTAAAMTVPVATFPSINTGAATTYWMDFTPATNAPYYIGFQSYGPGGGGGWILLDDISVIETPCFPPAAASLNATSITPSTATLNWSVPAASTPISYQYYISTVNSAPNFYTNATGNVTSGTSVAITGLTPSTTYYFWIRSSCAAGLFSSWSTAGSPGTFTTTVVTNISMSNTTITNCGVNYYDSGGSAANYLNNNENFTQTFIPATTNSKIKVVFSSFATEARWDFLRIYDGPNNTFPLLGTFSGTQIAAGRTFVSTAPNGELTFNFTSDGSNRAAGWAATVTCVTVPNIMSFSPASICATTSNSTVTLTGANFIGVTSVLFNSTSVGFTVVNDTTITASVPPSVTTGVITVASSEASTSSSTSFVVNPSPTTLVITPSSVARCQSDPAQLLSASGGIVPNIAVIDEKFNGVAAGWTLANASTGGTTTAPAWTLRPNNYNPGGFTGISALRSNDSSQFYLSNSDAQGNGSQTDVTLTSPTFSLVGFTSATLSFYHFYKAWNNGYGRVEIYNSTTATWVTLQQWNTDFPDDTQGAATNFKNQTYNLSAYLGMANLQVRFRYYVSWGYVWAIDNFLISGSSGTGVTWSSVPSSSPSYPDYTGLYTNAAATVAYTGVVGNTVYANPTTTTTYYGTATSVAGCSTTTTVPVTVTPIVAGVATGDQSICGGAPSDLVLTGSSGTIQWEYADNFGFTLGGPTAISGANAATLTSAQMGVLSANRFYRAKLTNGSCTTYSNVISVSTSLSTTTWNGSGWSNGNPSSTKAVVFNGAYASDNLITPGDISACNVYVTSLGSVTFKTGHTLTVQQSVNVDSTNGGSLTFEDGSSLLQPNDIANASGVYNGGNSGKITYKRVASPMYKFDYTYWSAPVNPQNLQALSPSTAQFFEYNALATTPYWQGITNASSTTMGVAKGYLVRAPSYFPVFVTPVTPLPQYYTASFQGVPNNGTQKIQIGVALGLTQYNLLGNPYPSAISADSFILANPNVGALYFWTHNNNLSIIAGTSIYGYNPDDYAIYTLAGGTGTQGSAGPDGAGINVQPNGYISAGQGFFTKGVATISGSAPYYATFTNTMRTAGNNGQFFKTGNVSQNNNSGLERHRYWIDIANAQGAFREVLVSYIETATLGIDRLFEGEVSESSNVISLYTLVENRKMAIQGRPLPFEDSDIVPLAYKTTIASTYTISMPQYDGLFISQHVYLEDKVLNIIHDLRISPYTFATEIGTFENRFILRYTTEALGTPVFNENSVVVYRNDDGLFINSGNEIMKSVTIYDIRGRVVADQKQVKSSSTVFTTLPTTQQVLLVKIEGENGGVVTKKVVY